VKVKRKSNTQSNITNDIDCCHGKMQQWYDEVTPYGVAMVNIKTPTSGSVFVTYDNNMCLEQLLPGIQQLMSPFCEI
jgi:hypothetical protein